MKHFSEETLNALVDGEYSAAEQAELLSSVQADETAAAELCSLRSVKQLVRTAYQDTPQAVTKTPWHRSKTAGLLAVASVLLAVALAVFLGNHGLSQAPDSIERFALIDPDGRGQQPALAENQETRIVLHLLNANMEAAGELLDEVEALLAEHRDNGKSLRMEIVAHSDGLALLRQRLSTHQARISRLAEAYPNLAFVACLNTVERLRVEQGIEVTLLPEARTTKSGVAHVVQRQKEGWAYIKV